ncbi:MAG: type II toxin-antitoxin system RelE/ParE family toxin [Rhizobiaceae bacterium]
MERKKFFHPRTSGVAWTVEYAASARKAVARLDPQARTRIRKFIEDRLREAEDPRCLAKPLKGKFATLWRFRVGDYRIICDIQDDRLVVLVVAIGHRRDVYR